MLAYNLVPSRFEDGRHDAITKGLQANGYEVVITNDKSRAPDVVVYWNLHGPRDPESRAFRRAGATVWVAEEGYTRGVVSTPHFALAKWGHNGSGEWRVGDDARVARLCLGMRSQQMRDGYVLVCGQRGIGSELMASPAGWEGQIAREIRDRGFEVKVRPHPGKDKRQRATLTQDIAGASAVVVWSSACALPAMLEGIPTYYASPCHVLAPGLVRYSRFRNGTELSSDRQEALRRMAWAQWTLPEITMGDPWRYNAQPFT